MNEDAFLSALRDDPTDEVTWHALADWLDEDGQADRAELLRLSRRLRQMPARKRKSVNRRVVLLLQAAVRPVVVERVNSIGMRFALVPPGRFLMGSRRGEEGRASNEDRHEVTITNPYWLGVFPVTQAQYQAVRGDNPSYFQKKGHGRARVKGMDTSDFPVENVAWADVRAFMTELARKDGASYRLPSEAEWEHACRGGLGFEEPFTLAAPSSTLSSHDANLVGSDPYGDLPRGPSLSRPCPVGSYEPNPLGIYDMHGNVWEWCNDWYAARYARGDPVLDPTGPDEGEDRIHRGGGWNCGGKYCRSAHRAWVDPNGRDDSSGFRVVLVPPAR